MVDEVAPVCACGCGRPVKKYRKGWRKFFRNGCQKHGRQPGSKEKVLAARGYVFVYAPDHPKSTKGGYVPEHIVIAEAALGKFLPDGSEVHHIDEDKTHNINSNLAICQDRGYHMLVHQRTDALEACGNANYRKCFLCSAYDNPKIMRHSGKGFVHWDCYRTYMRNYYQNNKEKWGVHA